MTLEQPMIDYVFKSHKYSEERKKLIKEIVKEVFKKHYLKNPENLQDAILNFLGTIEISIDKTKKMYKIK